MSSQQGEALRAELDAQWPSLENMPDGVDILREKYGPPTGKEETK